MGQFRIFTASAFAVLHIVALITLIILFSMAGGAFGFAYIVTSILAIIFAFLFTAGIVVLQVREVKSGAEGGFPFLLPVTTTVMIYDLAVLGLVLVGWMFSSVLYVSLHMIAAVAFIFSLILVGGFSQFVKKRDDEVKEQVGRIKQLQLHVHYVKMSMQPYNEERGMKDFTAKLDSLEEAIRFSDPVSHEAVLAVEDSIEEMLKDLRAHVEKMIAEGDMKDEEKVALLTTTVERIHHTVAYRNKELELVK